MHLALGQLRIFRDWLPHVGQRVVRDGGADFIGLGRMVLSYPDLPADVLAGRDLARKRVCRTFSDCTTAPRAGMISGCFPLDPFYRDRPERAWLTRPSAGPRDPAADPVTADATRDKWARVSDE